MKPRRFSDTIEPTRSRILWIAALALLAAAPRCGGGEDDVVRNAPKVVEFVADLLPGQQKRAEQTVRWVSSVGAAIPEAPPSIVPALNKVKQISDEFVVAPEVRDAFYALGWDATCAIATGELSMDVDSVAAWLTEWAYLYPVEYFANTAYLHAQSIVASVEADSAASAEEMCSLLGTYLLE